MKKCVMAAAFASLLLGCAHQETQADVRREIDNQDSVIQELRSRNEEVIAQYDAQTLQLEALRAENAALREQARAAGDVQSVASRIDAIESDLNALNLEALGGVGGDGSLLNGMEGVTAKPHAEGLAIEVQETLLFAPGEHTLTASGQRILSDLAERLGRTSGQIRVEGHTDSSPVRRTADRYPMGNLELSGRRALVVAHHLVAQGRLPADRVSYAGFGMHRPVASNDSPQNMSKNRRVEIVLQRPAPK